MTSSAQQSSTGSGRRSKYSQACNFCRLKKVKCELCSSRKCIKNLILPGDGGYPCKQCVDHLMECVFATKRRAPRRLQPPQETVTERLRRLESLIQANPNQTADVEKRIRAISDDIDAPASRGPPPAQDCNSQGEDELLLWQQTAEQPYTPYSNWSSSLPAANPDHVQNSPYASVHSSTYPKARHNAGPNAPQSELSTAPAMTSVIALSNAPRTADVISNDQHTAVPPAADSLGLHEDSSIQSNEVVRSQSKCASSSAS